MKRKKILIVTGELSGEMHAVELVKQISELPVELYGMGGELLANAGVDLLVNSKDLNIMFGLGIFTQGKKLYQAWGTLKIFIKQERPLVVLVDYPGFNLRLAKLAKKLGSQVLYFISPKIWAWNHQRYKKIERYVDCLAVIYPFEVEYYRRLGITAHYVGNAILEHIKQHDTVASIRQRWHLEKGRVVGLFPGSRASEIKYLLPTLLATAERLQADDRSLCFLLPQARTIGNLTPYLKRYQHLNLRVVEQVYDAIQVADFIIAASGTVTLEIALSLKPFIIIYRGSWLEYWLARMVLRIPYVGLCNILAERFVVPEFLQGELRVDKLVETVQQFLADPSLVERQIETFKELKNQLLTFPSTSLTTLVQRLI